MEETRHKRSIPFHRFVSVYHRGCTPASTNHRSTRSPMHLSPAIQTAAVILALGGVGVYRAQAPTRPSQQIKVSKIGTQPTYFVEHPDNIQPGLNLQSPLASLKNPYSGNPARIAEGGKLFVSYNCLDCH